MRGHLYYCGYFKGCAATTESDGKVSLNAVLDVSIDVQ